MNSETISEVRLELLDALQVDADQRELRQRVEQQIFALTDVLPEPEAWAALDKGFDTARVVLLAGDYLFTLAARSRETGQLVAASCGSRVLEVTCWHEEYEPASPDGPGVPTHWVFRLHHQDHHLRIDGHIRFRATGDETPNRAEHLARVLAERFGWTGQNSEPLVS